MNTAFIAGFAGDLLSPTDPGYDEVRASWNAMIDKRPALIARCRSADDVAAAVRYARDKALEIAVRAGGHSVAGHSSTDGGLLIDLRLMHDVVVDPSLRLVHVGGGALLGHLDRATHDHGLATTGGMVHHTGVGGLTLGGGYGWLARVHGLACDNLVSATVVTAAGEIVTASEDENADLFWAVRGGGGNFGIVSEFEFGLHPIGPVLSVQLRYERSDAHRVVAAYREVMGSAPRELCGLVGIETGRGSGRLEERGATSRELYVWYVFVGRDLEEGKRLGEPFRRAGHPSAERAEVLTYPEVQSATGEGSGPGRRHYWKGSLIHELSDAFLDAFVEQGIKSEGGCGIELFSLGGSISAVGEHETAYSTRAAMFDLLPAATWDDPKDDQRNIRLTRASWEALAPFAKGGVYVNDLGPDAEERVREGYASTTYDRLVELKDRWDPDNAFSLNANIRPSRYGPSRGAALPPDDQEENHGDVSGT